LNSFGAYLFNQYGELSMKKTSAILAATTLVASMGVYAQPLKNDVAPFAVNVPNLSGDFKFGVEG